MQRLLRTLLLLLLILSAFLVVRGYRFALLDQYEHLPLLHRMLDPDHLRNDWFTNEMDRLNARTYFVAIAAGVTWFAGDAAAHFALFVVCFGVLALGVIRLGSNLVGSRTAAVFGLLLMLFGPRTPIGAKDFVVNYMRHGMFATTGVVWGLALLLEKRWRLAWLLCGLATALHMRTGALGAMLLGVLTLMHLKEIRPRELMVSAAAFLLPALAANVPLLLSLRAHSAGLSDAEFVNIFARIRAPWHHLPSRFPWAAYEDTGLLFMLGVVALYIQPPTRYRREMYALVGTFIVLCFCAYFFVEVVPVATVLGLNLMRATVFFHLLVMIFLGGAVWWGLREGKPEDALPAAALALCIVTHITPFVPALIAVLWFISRGSRELRPVVTVASGLLAAAIALLAFVVVVKPSWGAAVVRSVGGSYVCLGLATLLASVTLGLYALWLYGGSRWQGRMRRLAPALWLVPVALVVFKVLDGPLARRFPGIHDLTVARLSLQPVYRSAADKMALWCRDSLPEDAVVVVPPDELSFRVKADRAIVVDFKAIPFTRDGLAQWRDRINDLLGDVKFEGGPGWHDALRMGYASLTVDDFRRLAGKYGASYVMMRRPRKLEFPLLHETEEFRLYEID